MRLIRTEALTDAETAKNLPVIGLLHSDDGEFSCWTLENQKYLIPTGTYTVNLGTHHPGTLGAYRCPELDTTAIGRSHIHIHIANRAEELLGCIAVGETQSDDGMSIERSGDAFRRLMKYLTGAFPFTLKVYGPER